MADAETESALVDRRHRHDQPEHTRHTPCRKADLVIVQIFMNRTAEDWRRFLWRILLRKDGTFMNANMPPARPTRLP
jgi:hypothetical protein